MVLTLLLKTCKYTKKIGRMGEEIGVMLSIDLLMICSQEIKLQNIKFKQKSQR